MQLGCAAKVAGGFLGSIKFHSKSNDYPRLGRIFICFKEINQSVSLCNWTYEILRLNFLAFEGVWNVLFLAMLSNILRKVPLY